ncbi:MAG: adenosylcobinamide amidohydrolase [Desulfobacteraceae bacterium IS3]|nr:MAG: adenosylcobinamide amidohydrolase [Desulfobacteraceae bacterium IS3]
MKSALTILAVICLSLSPAFSYPVSLTDVQGHTVIIEKRPERAISLVPGITEIIFRLGAGDAVRGVTHHDTYPPETSEKEIVGGFFSPSVEKIEQAAPDILFVSDIHKDIIARFKDKCRVIHLKTDAVSSLYAHIVLLGKIFDRADKANKLVEEIKSDFDMIARKTAKIPESEKKRVIRLMGGDMVMTPGDDSFQNEYIRLAGGIPPNLNKKGQIVPITEKEWTTFNPQVIYGCEGDRKTAEKFFSKPGWKDADAVKNGRIFYLPCDLTCRISSNAGYFTAWLGSLIYSDEFANDKNQIIQDHIVKSVPVSLNLAYIKDIRVVHSYIYDFIHKSLMIELNLPMAVVSTLEGTREGIRFLGNSYSPPPAWQIYHRLELKESRKKLYSVLKIKENDSSFLFTGADMDHLAIKKQTFKDMEVYALVTAGVKSNAVRMSKDTGLFYEPGTINMILLTNMKLSHQAMTRAIISATEAKTAALWDMDIRSTYTPLLHPATGTGTDNIIVAQGTGVSIENTGGHTKMGELIAKAVYEAVQDAVYKQNGLVGKRDIFERLKERKLSLSDLFSLEGCECDMKKGELTAATEEFLLDPNYAAFIESAFAVSDDYEQGLIKNLNFFKIFCDQVAENIAGHKIEKMQDFTSAEPVPVAIKMAFNAVLNGILGRRMN